MKMSFIYYFGTDYTNAMSLVVLNNIHVYDI